MKKKGVVLVLAGLLLIILGISLIGLSAASTSWLSTYEDSNGDGYSVTFYASATTIDKGESVTFETDDISNTNGLWYFTPVEYEYRIDGSFVSNNRTLIHQFKTPGVSEVTLILSFVEYGQDFSGFDHTGLENQIVCTAYVYVTDVSVQKTITILPSAGGSTYPGAGTYTQNGNLQVTVHPSFGYTFDYWTITVNGQSWTESPWNPYEAIYDGSKIQPHFSWSGSGSPPPTTQPTPVPTPKPSATPKPTYAPSTPHPSATVQPTNTPIIPINSDSERLAVGVFGALLSVLGGTLLWLSRRYF